jgi:1-deoxy-D-xylulose-5-phosphate reductoisomerase
LDFTRNSQLTFEKPDTERFPCLRLAYVALRIGGTMPAVLNAANEIAVQAFLDNKIRLSDIPCIIESVMNEHETLSASSLEAILESDAWARTKAREFLTANASGAGS